MIKSRFTVILSLLMLMAAWQPPSLFADNGNIRERDLSRIRKKIETLRAWQLTEELDLDEDTSSRLFPAMKKADKERWEIETRNRELVGEMSRALEGRNPDPGKINRILDELQSNRRELTLSEERHIDSVRRILSPADTARYLIFQIRFQAQIKQKAAEALRNRGQFDSDRGRMFQDRYEGGGSEGYGSDKSGGSSGSGGGRRR